MNSDSKRQQSASEEPVAVKTQAMTGACSADTIGLACAPTAGVECGGVCFLDPATGLPACIAVTNPALPAQYQNTDGMPCGTAAGEDGCSNSCASGVCVMGSHAPNDAACRPTNTAGVNACAGRCQGGACNVLVGTPCTFGRGAGAQTCLFQACSPLDPAVCINLNLMATTGCDDTLKCTSNDVCTAGVCGGTAVVCTALDQCHVAGSCDPSTGNCTNPNQANGTVCDDGAKCTTGDVCTAGTCGGTAVVCTALDQCHVAGVCNPATGSCSNPNQANGTVCDDAAKCTTGDVCTAGVCAGTAVVCTALDQCHVAGTCDSTSGLCSNPNKANGSVCNDNSVCTLNETCQNGSCTNGTAVVCLALNDCHNAGTCDPMTGCSNPTKPDLTACTPDVLPCTLDHCIAGTCSHPAGNAGTVCRMSAGDCDPAEACNGTLTTCPADLKSPASVECRAQNGNCDVAEHCAGGNSCPVNGYLPVSQVCRAASCTGGVATLSEHCPGNGPSCAPAQTQNCTPYICVGTACGSTCVNSTSCAAGNYCETGQCKAKKANGLVCSTAESCQSGQCVDGVCCNVACAGQCQACDVLGSVGTCSPVLGKPHGARTLCTSDGTACGGSCNGVLLNACGYPGNVTQCRAAACNNDVAVLAASCAGTGACPALQTQNCSPFKCSGTICGGDCTFDPDCASGSYCSAGICKPKAGSGADCSAANQCSSGYCVDAVCCNGPCNGQCEACALTGKVGTCSPVVGVPVGTRPACATDGTACGGACNGVLTATCNYPTASCRPPACTNEVATLAAACDGMGSCPPVQTQNCAPFKCSGPQCSGNCVVDTDCAGGSFCSGGVCHLKLDPGYSCAGDNQCNSGYCVDSVCCGGACVGQCEACDIGGQEGNCLAVTGAPHGARPLCTSDGSVCAGTCDGTQTMSCTYPDSSLQCRAPSCTNNVATLGASCTSIGACPAQQTQVCDPFLCVGDHCAGNCTLDTDCSSGHFCSAGVCTLKLEIAQPCGGNNQCTSGFCADGHCCNSACPGQCEACDVPNALGTCSVVIGAPHGGKGACGGAGACQGQCDGSSQTTCVFPGVTKECSAASCANGVQKSAAYCDGSGACGQGASKACGNYACSGATCLTACTTTADCTAGHQCVAKACVVAEAGPDAPLDAKLDVKTDGTPLGDAKKEGSTADAVGDAVADQGPAEGGGATPIITTDEGNCGCRVPGGDTHGRLAVAIAALGLIIARRRRRVREAE